MPLAFESQSHGTVAFGFFNIESDMLLLEQLFFFADRFCEAVTALARERATSATAGGASSDASAASIDGWRIETRAGIGNLHGAIAGVDLDGFIGATYREFPFPASPAEFKQSPEGDRTQALMAKLIARFGEPARFDLGWDRAGSVVRLGEFVFTAAEFGRLVCYVEQGGYPRYRDEVRPAYVQAMTRRLRELPSPWLSEAE